MFVVVRRGEFFEGEGGWISFFFFPSFLEKKQGVEKVFFLFVSSIR